MKLKEAIAVLTNYQTLAGDDSVLNVSEFQLVAQIVGSDEGYSYRNPRKTEYSIRVLVAPVYNYANQCAGSMLGGNES